MAEEADSEIGGYSIVDVDAVDLKKFPEVMSVDWNFAVVRWVYGEDMAFTRACSA